MKLTQLVVALLSLAFAPVGFAEAQPDLNTLSRSGFIMGPGDGSYPVHSAWKNHIAFMKDVKAVDSVVDRMEAILCSKDKNKSVLLVGESADLFRYVYARLAARKPNPSCPKLWHVEIDTSKIVAGHMYVGQVDQYWQDQILRPADGKDVVLYFASLDHLIGLGSHEHDSSGIEREYVANFQAGRLRTVAHMDQYQYNDLVHSAQGYVANAFAEKIVLPQLTVAQVDEMLQGYIKTLYPQFTFNKKESDYLAKMSSYYIPNRSEPERSFQVLQNILKGKASETFDTEEVESDIESKHPYEANANVEHVIAAKGYEQIQLDFESFETQDNYDVLTVLNGETGAQLDRFSGKLGAFKTAFYPVKSLKLKFTSNGTTQLDGYKLKSIITKTARPYVISQEDVRRAVLAEAQVPSWIVDRDYSVIKNLRANLDGDVVGCYESKGDLVRLAKNGYVAGRTDEKPIATVMFAGPTGTGKSYIAKRMADFMGLRLITVDMTAYKDPLKIVEFTETVSRALIANPYAVFLFEEIDKAAMEILDQLYFMMDEGIFYDRHQRPLFARGAFIMMTTNAGSDVILKEKDNPNLRKLVMADLSKAFRQSFLNRFDAISIFKPFTLPEFKQLAKTMVDKKISRLRDLFEWKAKIDEGTLDYVAKFGKSDAFGARPMERLVEFVIGGGIAEFQLEKYAIPKGSAFGISKRTGEHDFQIAVDSKDYLNYSVDYKGENGLNGSMDYLKVMLRNQPALFKFFETERMYND